MPPPQIKDLEGLFEKIISNAIALAGIVCFVLLIFGGFKYITSGGDPKRAESARSTLTWAVGGVVLLIVSYLILVLIENITGAKVTEFVITK